MRSFLLPIAMSGLMFSQGAEDPGIFLGIQYFQNGDFVAAQRYLSESLPRARDVSEAYWFLSLSNIAISKTVGLKEKENLLLNASGLLESLVDSTSTHEVGAAIAYADCVINTSKVKSLPSITKAKAMLEKVRKSPFISDPEILEVNRRALYLSFLLAQYQGMTPSESTGPPGSEEKKQGGDTSASKSPGENKNTGDPNKASDSSKGKKMDKKGAVSTDRSQAGKGNLDIVPYVGSLKEVSSEEAAKLISEAAKKVRRAAGEDSP